MKAEGFECVCVWIAPKAAERAEMRRKEKGEFVDSSAHT